MRGGGIEKILIKLRGCTKQNPFKSSSPFGHEYRWSLLRREIYDSSCDSSKRKILNPDVLR